MFKIIIFFFALSFLGVTYYLFAYKSYHFSLGKNLLQISESLSEEDKFYGVHHINSFIWKRIDYNFNPEIKEELDHYYDETVLKEFSNFSAVVYDFAKKRDARIEKYYKDLPIWMLQFYHPSGGLGRINISLHPSTKPNGLISVNENSHLSKLSPVITIHSIWTAPGRDSINDSKTNITITDPANNVDLLMQSLETHYKNVLNLQE